MDIFYELSSQTGWWKQDSRMLAWQVHRGLMVPFCPEQKTPETRNTAQGHSTQLDTQGSHLSHGSSRHGPSFTVTAIKVIVQESWRRNCTLVTPPPDQNWVIWSSCMFSMGPKRPDSPRAFLHWRSGEQLPAPILPYFEMSVDLGKQAFSFLTVHSIPHCVGDSMCLMSPLLFV